MKGLQKLIETLIYALPSLMNVGALLILFYFIFSVLGVFLFGEIKQGLIIDEFNNFSNFGASLITLFRCSTGENWWMFMFDVMKTDNCQKGVDCGTVVAPFFFIIYITATTFVMIQIFILILVQYFEDYNMKEDNPLELFHRDVENFRFYWSKYTQESNGTKIKTSLLIPFL